jgi:uncharacterized protein (TIGR04255 family)
LAKLADKVTQVPWSPESVSSSLGEPYPNAPINEAVFDVRIAPLDSSVIPELEEFGRTEEERYPVRAEINKVGNQINLNPEKVTSSIVQERFGYSFQGRPELFQARLDGFTFNRLRPYEDWLRFSSEAFRLFTRYVEVAHPSSISRIALRYINQIDVPSMKDIDLDQYLRSRPIISPVLPQTLEGYFLSTQIQLMDPGPRLQLIQTVVNPSPTTVGLILDIDVFWEETLDVTNPALEDLLHERFDILRKCKNAVFEGCITDEARSLFR